MQFRIRYLRYTHGSCTIIVVRETTRHRERERREEKKELEEKMSQKEAKDGTLNNNTGGEKIEIDREADRHAGDHAYRET